MQRLINALTKNGFSVVDRGAEGCVIDAETGDFRVDYYRNYWTPELDAITQKHGYFTEWVTAGEIKILKA